MKKDGQRGASELERYTFRMSEPAGIALPDVPPPAATPVAPSERILLLDTLRGFAVFGILVVNMLFFSGPFEWILHPPWTAPADRVAGFVITAFFSGKFYSIFSILFGIGFAIQMQRGDARGGGTPDYLRRLAILFAIGVAHAAFLWYGDILHLYAVLGVALLVFRRARIDAMVPVAIIAVAIPPGLAALGALASSFAPERAVRAAAEMFRTAEALRNYATGTWGELTRQRVADWLMLDSFAVFFAPSVFAMMLLGLIAAKAGILGDIERRRTVFRRALLIAAIPGVAGNLLVASTRHLVDVNAPSLASVGVTAAQAIAVPSLALVYISAIALAVDSGRASRFVALLAPVGRMALTNYLLQSVIATLVFYSYGLGLFGRVGPAATSALAVAIFAMQIAISAWWMKRFRFGPAEWLWRSLTYGRMQLMRA